MMEARIGALLLMAALVIPAIVNRTRARDLLAFPTALIMYALAMFGAALLWAAE